MICRCGHPEEKHLKVEQLPQVLLGQLSLCQEILITVDRQHIFICRCTGYEMDNLKSLEQKYLESIK